MNGDLCSSTWCSDRRLKKNISTYKNALSKLKALKTYTYDFIDKEKIHLPEGKQYGFIAQEVEKVFPNLVIDSLTHTDSTVYKGIEKEKFVPVLAQAIKEQQQIIEQQQEENATMKEQLQSQNQQIQSLKESKQRQQQQIEALQEAVQTLQQESGMKAKTQR
ncbi:MAG: hypothetical protein BRD50_01215 [Bacteroidetes bacterium SW_11_45_7]|nr:MAG: hypothetical protein BRD50_01215 [Bacteroidetes bacterium SW_11_45_7]